MASRSITHVLHAHHSKNLKILLVEDNPLVQRVHCNLLASLGCCIQSAKTGGGAIHLTNRKKFDLILMDLELPDANGL